MPKRTPYSAGGFNYSSSDQREQCLTVTLQNDESVHPILEYTGYRKDQSISGGISERLRGIYSRDLSARPDSESAPVPYTSRQAKN